MVSAISSTPGSIGFLNYGTANLAGIASARLKNARNQWVTPTVTSITAATVRLQDEPLPRATESWWDVDLTNQNVDGAWPIVTFVYFLCYQDLSSLGARGAALVGLFTYINTEDVQSLATELGFVPLPSWVRYSNAAILDELVISGDYNRTSYYDPTPTATPPRSMAGKAAFSIILTIGLFIFLIAVIVYEITIAKRWRQ